MTEHLFRHIARNLNPRTAMLVSTLVAVSACTAGEQASTVDIAGLQLGMGKEAVLAVLEEHAETIDFRGYPTYLEYEMALPGLDPFVGLQLVGKTGSRAAMVEPKGSQDLFVNLFGPGEEGLLAIYRSIGFESDNAPTLEDFRASITEKYGDPATESASSENVSWTWKELSTETWDRCVIEGGLVPLETVVDDLIRFSRDMIGGSPRPVRDIARDAYLEGLDVKGLEEACGTFFDVYVTLDPNGTRVRSAAFLANDFPALKNAAGVIAEATSNAPVQTGQAVPRL